MRPGETCTHLIFKAGRSSTLSWYHKHPEPKPFLLEASWVTKSKDAGRMLSEADFAIDVNEQAVFNRVRPWLSRTEPELTISCRSASQIDGAKATGGHHEQRHQPGTFER